MYLEEKLTPESKLTHLEHVEDHFLNSGHSGYHHGVNNLQSVKDHLQGKQSAATISTKYDGSPSIVFGRHPDTGRFFVGSKSVFNVEPKINYSEEDIDRNHGHAPGLAQKLKHALRHLPKVTPPTGVFQGDVMYSREKEGDDVTEKDGKYHFTPNTITYSTDKNSEHGKAIKKAKFGVVVHTAYKGKSFDKLEAEYNPEIRDFQSHPDVHVISSAFKPSKKLSPQKSKQVESHIAEADKAIGKFDVNPHPSVSDHHSDLKSYINQQIVASAKPTVEGYKKWATDKAIKEASKVKTPAVKAAKLAKHQTRMNVVDQNRGHFQAAIDTHHHLQQAKGILVDHMSSSSEFETSVNGKKVKPEGFVSVINNRPTKLVDREEFSRTNALISKNRKEQAPEETRKGRHITISYGRMNPPHTGHQLLAKKLIDNANEEGGDHLLVLSHSTDPKKNPLTPEQKLKHAKRLFPENNIKVSDSNSPTLLHHLANLHAKGYEHATVVAGSDRVPEFEKLVNKYNGVKGSHGFYNFKTIKIASSGERDPDSDEAEGNSASKMRGHVTNNDFPKFKKGLPSHVSDQHAKELYNDVKNGMK
jgi:hypothetical protein